MGVIRRNKNSQLRLGGGGLYRLIFSLLVGVGAFTVAFVSASLLTPPSPSQAKTLSATLNGTSYYASIEGAEDDVTLTAYPTPDGVYVSALDSLTVRTNATNGYKMYLTMADSDQNLYLAGKTAATATSKEKIIPTVGDQSIPRTLDTNSWGYAIAGASGFSASYAVPTPAANSLWAQVPAATAENTSPISSSGTAETTGVSVGVYYGVKLSSLLTTGSYSGTVVYSLLADTDANGASITPSTVYGPGTVSIITPLMTDMDLGTVEITIGDDDCTSITQFTQNGLVGFTCTAPDLTVGSSGTTYPVVIDIPKFGQTYNVSGGLTYIPSTPAFYTITAMQDMTTAVCNSVATPAASVTDITTTNEANKVPQTTLTDSRDGSSYVVRKLADGNCWMVQNLDLLLSTGTTLTSEKTDLGYGGSGRTSFTPEHDTQANTGTAWAQNGSDGARSYENGTKYLINGTTVSSTMGANGQREHMGNYYNWYAATAGQGTSSFASDNVEANTTDSICPKGWTLPTDQSSSDKSFMHLLIETMDNKSGSTWTQTTGLGGVYGLVGTNTWDAFSSGSLPAATHEASATALISAPLDFVRSGRYGWSNGTLNYQGSYALYWSATAYSGTNAYYLDSNSSRIFPRRGSNKGNGYSVRCVSR